MIEKALEDVNQDKFIIEELDKRKTCREKGIPYRDESSFPGFSFLPEQLQPRATGLTDEEFRIYDDFGKRTQNF